MSVYGPDGQYLGPMGTPPPSLPDDEVINVNLPYSPYRYNAYDARKFSGREDYDYPPAYRYLRRHLDPDDPPPRKVKERRYPSRSRERERRYSDFEYEHGRPGLRRHPVDDCDEEPEPAPRYRRHRSRSSYRDRCTTCSRCADARPSRDANTDADFDLTGIFSALRALTLGEQYAAFKSATTPRQRYQAPSDYTYHRPNRYRPSEFTPPPSPPPREPSWRSYPRRPPPAPSPPSDSDFSDYKEARFRDDLYTINGRMMGPGGRRRGWWSEFIEIPMWGGESFEGLAGHFLRNSGDGFHAIKMRKDLNSGRAYLSRWVADNDDYY
ncbi:hypothetical protein Dda_9035 [Drechslerella dactyloides]|uniref:Uncharacterized protein n=1 Tax=Drechslerella dactyloides TaxID=74499 RepID=A0AAD6IRG9_DREDA|nr:hypothetical protein Dda_9035 [Drechslerella dactyloides]